MKCEIEVDANLEIWQILGPRIAQDLTNVGGFKGGGYVVPLEHLSNVTTFVNFGVGEDFDFEIEQLRKYNASKIISFDSLVSNKYFIIHFLQGLIKFVMFRCGIRVVFLRLVLLLKFLFFYSFLFNMKFFKVKVDEFEARQILSVLQKNSALKVDIEGGEYVILDTILEYKSRLDYIIIEFHSINANIDTIINFVKNLGSEFFIAHLSLNNRISDINFLPQTIEVTICRSDTKHDNFVDKLPNDKVDWHYPNRPIYVLNFISKITQRI